MLGGLGTKVAWSPSSRKAGIEIYTDRIYEGYVQVAFLTEGGD